MVVMSFLTNCLIDGIGEDCSGGEAALNQALMNIFLSSGGCLLSVRLILV